jgi:excisionase family DNA binding protein
MNRRDRPPVPQTPQRPRVEVVTLTVDELHERMETFAARVVAGYDHALREIAGRLDAPALKSVLTTKEAGDLAGVEPGTVLKWISQGLPASRRGRGYRVRRADLEAWITR